MTKFKQRLDKAKMWQHPTENKAAIIVPSEIYNTLISDAEELHAEVERLEYDRQFLAHAHFRSVEKLTELRAAADKMKEALEHLVGSKTVDDQGRERYTMDVSPLMRTTTHNLYHAHRTAVEALSTYEQARGE